jgi:hypothetical protein
MKASRIAERVFSDAAAEAPRWAMIKGRLNIKIKIKI